MIPAPNFFFNWSYIVLLCATYFAKLTVSFRLDVLPMQLAIYIRLLKIYWQWNFKKLSIP